MEVIIFLAILLVVLISAGVSFYYYLVSNQKSFDDLKDEQKKMTDALKRAAIQEAKERALKAKEKKRQKKAAAKMDDRKSTSISSVEFENSEAQSEKENKEVKPKSQPKQNNQTNTKKQNQSNEKQVSNTSTTKANKTKELDNTKTKDMAPTETIKNKDTTTSRENPEKSNPNVEQKGNTKKKKPEILSENIQNVENVSKNVIKEKEIKVKEPLVEKEVKDVVVNSEPPKEQRTKKENGVKKQPDVQQPLKEQPKQVVEVKQKQQKVVPNHAEVIPVVKEIVLKETKKQISSVTSSPSSVKGSKKKKNDITSLLGNEKDSLDYNLLMPIVVKAELSNTEIETVIETLLNKQASGGAMDWSEGRQDPLIKIKRQLEEKEKLLASEKEISKGIQSKLGELRSELNSEKHKTRQMEETLAARTGELQSYAMRLKQINDEKVHQAQSMQGKLNDEHMLICQLKDKTMKDECVQQDLMNQIQSRDVHIGRLTETLGGMEAQIAQMAIQLQEQEAISGGLSEELNLERENGVMVRERLVHQESHIQEMSVVRTELEHRLGQAQFDVNRLQGENKIMADQLNNKKGEDENQGSKLKSLQGEINTLQDNVKKLKAEVAEANEKAKQAKEENESLAAQIAANTERPAAEGRETNDELNESRNRQEEDGAKYQLIIEEKEKTIETLKKELNAKEKDVNSITSELSSKKIEITKLSKDIAQQESLVKQLSSELNTHKSKVADLTAQVDAQKKKNDELRNKNYSVMEALSKTEKSLESKIKQSQDSVETSKVEAENATRQLLQRVFPQIVSPASSKDHKVWLAAFESSLKKWIEEKEKVLSSSTTNGSPASDSSEHSPGVISELEKQNSQLQNMVTNYKSIIADTEGMLNKLQTHVEQEETKWRSQIQALEVQLETVTTERDQIEEQLQKMASTVVTNDSSSYDSKELIEEIKVLQKTLNEEKDKTNEVNKELLKLKSQIKIGTDALESEQKTVEQLQSQIAQMKKSQNDDSISIDSNGLNNNEKESPASAKSKKKNVSGWFRKKLKGSSSGGDGSDEHNNSVTE